MIPSTAPKLAYVVKRYPRYSETFIVNEILAHEAAGLDLVIFALRPPCDTHFQDVISKVRSPVYYVPYEMNRAADFWSTLQANEGEIDFNDLMRASTGESLRDVYQALALAKMIRAQGIGHMHAHFASMATTIARLAGRMTGVPYTFTAHAKDIFHEDVSSDDLRRKIEEAAGVITVSDFNVAHLTAEFPDVAPKVRRIYNGIDFGRFTYSAPAERPRRIISVGRLVEKKGFPVLLDACALLRKRNVPFECQITGAGEQEALLKARIAELSLGDRVIMTGPQPQAEIATQIQKSALFAAPCVVGEDGNRDGLPTVLLESMALGTPCVSTDVTGIPEVLKHDETGLMVPQNSAAELANAMERLLGDSALRVRLATAARALVEKEFNASVNVARMRESFSGLQRAAMPVGDSRSPMSAQ